MKLSVSVSGWVWGCLIIRNVIRYNFEGHGSGSIHFKPLLLCTNKSYTLLQFNALPNSPPPFSLPSQPFYPLFPISSSSSPSSHLPFFFSFFFFSSGAIPFYFSVLFENSWKNRNKIGFLCFLFLNFCCVGCSSGNGERGRSLRGAGWSSSGEKW